MPNYRFILDGDRLIFRLVRNNPFIFIVFLLIVLASSYVWERLDVSFIFMMPCLFFFWSAFYHKERMIDAKDRSLLIYSYFLFPCFNWHLNIRRDQIVDIQLNSFSDEGVTIFRLILFTKLGKYCLNEYLGSKTETEANHQFQLVRKFLDI